jgi:hypothetical protein
MHFCCYSHPGRDVNIAQMVYSDVKAKIIYFYGVAGAAIWLNTFSACWMHSIDVCRSENVLRHIVSFEDFEKFYREWVGDGNILVLYT